MNPFFSLFQISQHTKALQEQVKADQKALTRLKQEYNAVAQTKKHYANALSAMTESLGAMVWEKDKEHRYIIANPLHCAKFFQFTDVEVCLELIKGYTDYEVATALNIEGSVNDTFAPVCGISDDFISKMDNVLPQPAHFLEIGTVASTKVALYVIKTPQFDAAGNFKGSVGIGWDFSEYHQSSQYAVLQKFLTAGMCGGTVETIYSKDETASYFIKPAAHKCKLFNHLCPEVPMPSCL
jgi:hypothetical protein